MDAEGAVVSMRCNSYLDSAPQSDKSTVKAFLIAGGVVGGFILVANYLKNRLGGDSLSEGIMAVSSPQSSYKRVTVELRGSFGVLPSGLVTISKNGTVITSGSLYSPILVQSSGPVDIAISSNDLVDQPVLERRGVVLPASGAITVRIDVATGLVRSQATVGGRTVSGVVRLFRVNLATGAVDAASCGSMGANTNSREISVGTYRAVLQSGTATLSQNVTVDRGSSKLVRLVA